MEILIQLYEQFKVTCPRLIAALVVIIIGLNIAKIVSKVISATLAKSGIDKLGDDLNKIEMVEKFNVKIEISNIVAKIVHYVLVLVFLIAATDILGMQAISQLVSDIINYVPLVISAGVVLMIGIVLADFLKGVVLSACLSLGIPSAKIIANVVFYFIFINAIVSALSQAKIDTDFIKTNLTVILAAGAGAFALGYGLASKDLMSSFLASFYHKNRFDIGDIITIDGVTGEIIEMDNACITLSVDNKKVMIPASKLHTEKVEIHNQ